MGAIQLGTRPMLARSHMSLASAILPPASGITGSPVRVGSAMPVSAQPRSMSSSRSIPKGATWAAARSSDVNWKYSPTPHACARPGKNLPTGTSCRHAAQAARRCGRTRAHRWLPVDRSHAAVSLQIRHVGQHEIRSTRRLGPANINRHEQVELLQNTQPSLCIAIARTGVTGIDDESTQVPGQEWTGRWSCTNRARDRRADSVRTPAWARAAPAASQSAWDRGRPTTSGVGGLSAPPACPIQPSSTSTMQIARAVWVLFAYAIPMPP